MDIFFLLDGRHNLGRLLKREKIYFILGHFYLPQTEKGEMDFATRLFTI
jgi:hypothetical protein